MKDRRSMKTLDVVLCGLFAALIAIGAFLRVTLPTQPYPFTFSLQWLFVLLAGMLLGPKLGAMSVGAYLLVGLVGVPVFVHGGGPQYIFRAGFGFLLGFLAAAFVIGLLTERVPRLVKPADGEPTPFLHEFLRLMVGAVAGLIVYYAIGIAYYYFMYTCVLETPAEWGIGIAVAGCMTTFLPDLALCAVAGLATTRLRPAMWAALRR